MNLFYLCMQLSTLIACKDKTMKHLHYYICLLLLMCSINICHADIVNDEVFHFVTKEDGLSGESVSRIMPDYLGRMWIATSNGVSLYNGKRIVTFQLGDYGNYVFELCESEDHTIYAATEKGIFEKRKGEADFHKIHPEITKAETILASKGKLYAGNREGFHIFDEKKSRLITVGATRMGVENGVRDIETDAQGNIWFLSRYALNCYHPQTGKYHSYVIANKMPKGAALSRLAIWKDKFFIGTKNNGLFIYNLKTHTAPYPISGVGNVITYLQVTSHGEVTVATDGSGAFLLDANTLSIKERYHVKADRKHQLPSDAVYCFVKDAHGVNWFGFFRFGMSYTYYRAPIFQRYHFGDFTTEGLNVRSFYIGNQVKIIGTNEGLYYVDEAHKQVRQIPMEQLQGAHIFTSILYYKGLYYIATYDGGLLLLNPKSFAVTRIPGQPLLTTTTIASLDVSRDGKLWIGTGEGVFVWDGESHITRYTENNSRLCGGVTTVRFDHKGNGWACSQGISLYVAATKTFENSHFPNGFFNMEVGLNCVRGHQGLMFFPKLTKIFYTNPAMTQFGQLDMPNEFVGSKCYGFLDDMKGYYWIATDQGLYRLNYQMQDLQHFGYGEGLMCQFINTIGMDDKGGIWVATSNGLMEVNKQALESWLRHNPYHIALYDIRRGSDLMEYALEDHANDERSIRIHWNIFSEKLSFRILLQDYARLYGRLYQYKLEGDKEWQSVSDGKDVEITHLLPGIHQLKVRLAGAPATERTYQITVIPSWLAILELIILIAALVLLLMWRNYHKNTKVLLDERNEIEGALMEIEQEKAELEVQQDLENEAVGNEPLESDVEETMGKATSQKYARVKVDEKEFADIVERMKAYIEEKHCYTNPDLKMSDLAEVLGLSSSKLSQVFSLYVKENYYEFINRYRLEEFKRLIAQGEYKKYTLTALSEKCGFKKSSFFSTFRRVEGMTPTEFLKAQNIKL